MFGSHFSLPPKDPVLGRAVEVADESVTEEKEGERAGRTRRGIVLERLLLDSVQEARPSKTAGEKENMVAAAELKRRRKKQKAQRRVSLLSFILG